MRMMITDIYIAVFNQSALSTEQNVETATLLRIISEMQPPLG